MLRVLALGWLGSGVWVLLAAEAGLGVMLVVSKASLICVLSTSLEGQHKAQPNLQHHTICSVQPVPAGG